MFRPSRFTLTLITLIAVATASLFTLQSLAGMNSAPSPGPIDAVARKSLWKQVDQDVNNDLPESAAEKLEQIYENATGDKDYPEASLALCRKILILGKKNQPALPYIVTQLQTAIPDAPKGMQPVLKTILAHWFFSYYQQNRWRFRQRTETTAEVADDFQTWSLPRLLRETDKLMTEALASADELKKLEIAKYAPLIKTGDLNPDLRPTMYDFIAFQGLDFYSLDEQFIRHQGAFEIDADSPMFAALDEFLAWKPETVDEHSYLLRAVRLYQDVIRFHQNDDDKSALLDADLQRLLFGKSASVGQDAQTTARYQEALSRFAAENKQHALSSLALAHLATSLQANERLVEAVKIAEQGAERHPKSFGARTCLDAIGQIKSKSVSITTETVWSKSATAIDVKYKNIDKVYFKLIAFDFENWKDWGKPRSLTKLDQDRRDQLLHKKPAAEWSVKLPATDDYQTRIETIPVNVDVPSGCYVVVSSHNPDFSQQKENSIAIAEVWVSELALVIKQHSRRENIEGWVVDADSGKPILGANVRKIESEYDGRNRRELEPMNVTTDKQGFFSLPHADNNLKQIFVTYGKQKLGLVQSLHSGRLRITNGFDSTIFFTDRAIYRPGQTIQFKGICFQPHQKDGEYKTLVGRQVTVKLYDANDQKVETREFKTNEFGSFNGSFTAPRDRATGEFRLTSSMNGSTTVRIEEYKRPKFYVEVEKPKKASQLDQAVQISGTATA